MVKLYDIPDFHAKVRFYTFEEGGRKLLPMQGMYRPNLCFPGEVLKQYSIWPEFTDESGNPYPENIIIPDYNVHANYYIFARDEQKPIVEDRLKIGTIMHIAEGAKIVGEIEIVKIY